MMEVDGQVVFDDRADRIHWVGIDDVVSTMKNIEAPDGWESRVLEVVEEFTEDEIVEMFRQSDIGFFQTTDSLLADRKCEEFLEQEEIEDSIRGE